MSPAAKYAVVLVGVAVLVIIVQLVLHSMRTEPRDSRMIADRELTVNVVEPGETVQQVVSVVRRTPVDYFRATRGILALTSKRIVFLGLRPRDMLAPSDAPPAFEQQDFPLDTAVKVRTGRVMAWLSKGIIVETPDETIRLAVPGTAWPDAQKLASRMETTRGTAVATARRQEELRTVAEAEWKRAVEAWRRPQYYTVRRGDALGSVATMWNTTPEKLQQMNKLPDNRIRVGQSLLVREAMD
jgi:LysM repeat protein